MGRTVVTERDVIDPTTARELDRRRQKLVTEWLEESQEERRKNKEGEEAERRKNNAEEEEERRTDAIYGMSGAGRLAPRLTTQTEEEEERRTKEDAVFTELQQLYEARTASLPPSSVDGYIDRLLKYIPAESVALYLTLQGIILSSVDEPSLNAWLWIIFGIGVIGTPMYLWRITQVSKRKQLIVSTLAFIVWVFALGGAFVSLSWYEPFIGSVVLVVFTFFAPLISPDNVLRTDQA